MKKLTFIWVIFFVFEINNVSNAGLTDNLIKNNSYSLEQSGETLERTTFTYLDSTDPIYILIKDRVINDMKETIDPESIENKLIRTKIETLNEVEKNQFDSLFGNSIMEYTSQINFDVGTLMMVFNTLANESVEVITKENDIRVFYLEDNKYAAEFWEDGIEVNSEEHALQWANELALRYPDDTEIVKNVKENYANVRKSMEGGEVERYSKVMALLYTTEKDGSILYHNPFQVMIDFINKNNK